MGQNLSEDEALPQAGQACSERYLHWLLSDPARIQEAFRPVWHACSGEESGSAPRDAVLDVMLRVVVEFEQSATEAAGFPGGEEGAGKTSRQLEHVAGMMPDRLLRAEALHLFRTALLATQALLVTRAGAGAGPPADPQSPGGLGRGPGGRGLHAGGGGGAEEWAPRVPERPDDAHATSQGARTPLAGSPQSALGPRPGPLPSRQELEAENEHLERLRAVAEQSVRSERAVVAALEAEEARLGQDLPGARRPRGAAAGAGAAPPALEAQALATEEELGQLESKVQASERALRAQEREVTAQQGEIRELLRRHGAEESSADGLAAEARDLALELKSCRRACGSLESEIASEEARAAALREAFEGRRARFATAETAARNAEVSTMRATRRRSAAEASARREAQAVEAAQHRRGAAAAEGAARLEALAAAVADARTAGMREEAVAGAADASARHGAAVTSQATFGAESALAALRSELRRAERERDDEAAAARGAAGEVAELELARARLEGQLAGRESELRRHAAQRARSLGEESAEARLSALRAAEDRVATGRRRELELEDELRSAMMAQLSDRLDTGGSQPDGGANGAAAWHAARELAAELGEARAALARRRALERSGSGEAAVASLRAVLRDAEGREARSAGELAEVRRRAQDGEPRGPPSPDASPPRGPPPRSGAAPPPRRRSPSPGGRGVRAPWAAPPP